MNNLNSILIEGNLTRDPLFKQISDASAVCTISIAVNRRYKIDGEFKEEVSYIDVDAWGNLAENCRQYLNKGRGVRVVGRIKQERWSDAEGNTQSKIKIIAEHIEFRPNFRGGQKDSAAREGEAADENGTGNGNGAEAAHIGNGTEDSSEVAMQEEMIAENY